MGRIYNALDRFLPFDRYLDPMFGGQPQAPQMGASMPPPMRQPTAPQIAPQGGVESVMGFPAMPAMQAPQAASQPPQRTVPRKGDRVSPWRVLDRVLGGGMTFSEATDAERARPQEIAAREQRQQQIQQFAQTLPDHERGLFLIDPEEWVKKNADRYAPHDPSVVGGAMVAPSYGPNGWSADPLYTAAEKPVAAPPAPNGYRWRSDGMGLEYIPGGPADPRTVGARASAGRAPPRVSGGGRGGAAAGGGGAPWARDWSRGGH